MNALSQQPVSRHPLGAEIRLYVIYRLIAAVLVAMMLVIIGVYLKLVARYGGRPVDSGV